MTKLLMVTAESTKKSLWQSECEIQRGVQLSDG